MGTIKIRSFFNQINQSNVFDINEPIPLQYAIPNVRKTFQKGGLIIRDLNQSNNNWKTFSMKWSVISILIIMTIKSLVLVRIDTTIEQNQMWIYILGDLTIIISDMRDFFLIASWVSVLSEVCSVVT
jgi:hypothetical protein